MIDQIDPKGKLKKGEVALLYDGVCLFCESYMLFLMKREKAGKVRFAALQSNFGQDIIKQMSGSTKGLDSVLLLDDQGRIWDKSDVALRLSKLMNGLWPVAQIFFIVPKGIRNVIYDWVARNRYKWFGKKELCEIPTAADRKRFLD